MKRTFVVPMVLGLVTAAVSAAPVMTFSIQYTGSYLQTDATHWQAVGDQSAYFQDGADMTGYNPLWQHDFRIAVSISGVHVGYGLQEQFLYGFFCGIGVDTPGSLASSGTLARFQETTLSTGLRVTPAITSSYFGLDPMHEGRSSSIDRNFNQSTLATANGAVTDTYLPITELFSDPNAAMDNNMGCTLDYDGTPQLTPFGNFRVTWDPTQGALRITMDGRGTAQFDWAATCDQRGNLQMLGGTDAYTGPVYYYLPEPATMALMVLGGMGLLRRRRSR